MIFRAALIALALSFTLGLPGTGHAQSLDGFKVGQLIEAALMAH